MIFKNDNEVRVNVTTGAVEGTFAVTLNNGISATFPNRMLITLGTVFKPNAANWLSPANIDVIEESSVKVLVKDVQGSAELKTSFFEIPATAGFSMRYNYALSPLESYPQDNYNQMILCDSVTDAEKYKIVTADLIHYLEKLL